MILTDWWKNPTNIRVISTNDLRFFVHISIVEKREPFRNLHPVFRATSMVCFGFAFPYHDEKHLKCSWAASLRMARQPWPAICGMCSVYFMMFELKMYYIIYILLNDILCIYIYIYVYICHIQCILDILLSTTGHKLIIDMNIPLSNHFTIHPPGDNNHALHTANVRCFPGYYIYM